MKCPTCGQQQSGWTEQQERLLRAAQDVVNDVRDPEREFWPDEEGPGVDQFVEKGYLDALKAVVQEISDDAVKEIERARLGSGCTCGEAYGSRPEGKQKCGYCIGATR